MYPGLIPPVSIVAQTLYCNDNTIIEYEIVLGIKLPIGICVMINKFIIKRVLVWNMEDGS